MVARGYRGPQGRGLATLVGGLLTTTGVPVSHARAILTEPAPPAEATADSVESSEAFLAAKQAYKEGLLSYGRADYQAALRHFSASFDAAEGIEDEARRYLIFHQLRYNLARAHFKSYRIDGARTHLTQALDLLETYLEDRSMFESETGAKELAEAEALAADVRALLAEHDAGAEAAAAPVVAAPGEVEGDVPLPGDDREKTDRSPRKRAPNSLLLGGYVSLGLAVAGLGVMGGGMAVAASADETFETTDSLTELNNARSRGELGNVMTYAGAGAAVLLGGVGATLVVLGLRQRRDGSSSAHLRAAPTLGRTHAGLTLGGRF